MSQKGSNTLMTIQEQIQQDVNLVSENSILQTQLFDFLKLLKANLPFRRNVQQVLSHAGVIDDAAASEVTKIINDEFGQIDGEWH
ncbi:hypothetical protein [Dyadobacter sp. CY323]|uniref:hypothetical protein n=1 Tax=Dyadobacter sp. CY323 TaxID=2907302 RepID=UPI001F2C5179|nr:hypothetical protein [Dyadobacter sp. CY323]MCE6991007.1 hypothetical protein [Dyadobacter sp. CY323]